MDHNIIHASRVNNIIEKGTLANIHIMYNCAWNCKYITMYIRLCMHVDIIEHAGYEEAKMSATHSSSDFNCFIHQI